MGGEVGGVLAILLVGLLIIPAVPANSSSAVRPNVLIIQTDDQRPSADSYAVMDSTMATFREQGTEFPNAVATTPLCCPSRASTFSGRFVHNNGVTRLDNPENLDQTTTVQYQLRRSGYTTAHVGKVPQYVVG